MRPARVLLDVLRGALIGLVEIVPGVSGGTIALVVGIYESLIESAGHGARGLVQLVVGPVRGRGLAPALEELRAVRWSLVLPVLAGMVVAVLSAARVLAPLIEEHPVESRAFFAGLILVSIAVPARMVGGRWRRREVLYAVAAAALAFLLTGLPPSTVEDPSLWVVGPAAAVAICALVLPGVSGSFILLAMGLYEPTLDALNDRDLGYVAVFALGAAVGLGAFVEVLRWLLHHHHRATLAVMTGVMVGSLRALWPWQDEDSGVLAPTGDVQQVVLVFLAGLVAVSAVLLVATLAQRRPAGADEATPTR